MLMNIPRCKFSLEFSEVLHTNLICYHWWSVSGNSEIMHCGIFMNIPYRSVLTRIYDFRRSRISLASTLMKMDQFHAVVCSLTKARKILHQFKQLISGLLCMCGLEGCAINIVIHYTIIIYIRHIHIIYVYILLYYITNYSPACVQE